jgi:hypothetical protein
VKNGRKWRTKPLSGRSGCLGLYGSSIWRFAMHPFNEVEKLFFPIVVNLAVFVAAFLIALIPCSFASFVKNRGSVKRILSKIPVYAFYFSVAAMAVTFITSLTLYLNMKLCAIGELIAMLCIFSVGVVPFGFILLATWILIMLFMLLRDRILSRRGNRVSGGG